jgi:hypothetical protein
MTSKSTYDGETLAATGTDARVGRTTTVDRGDGDALGKRGTTPVVRRDVHPTVGGATRAANRELDSETLTSDALDQLDERPAVAVALTSKLVHFRRGAPRWDRVLAEGFNRSVREGFVGSVGKTVAVVAAKRDVRHRLASIVYDASAPTDRAVFTAALVDLGTTAAAELDGEGMSSGSDGTNDGLAGEGGGFGVHKDMVQARGSNAIGKTQNLKQRRFRVATLHLASSRSDLAPRA